MNVLELSRTAATADRSASLTLELGRRTYTVLAGRSSVTVLLHPITRRSLGRTFHSSAELAAHYRDGGAALARAVDDWLGAWGRA